MYLDQLSPKNFAIAVIEEYDDPSPSNEEDEEYDAEEEEEMRKELMEEEELLHKELLAQGYGVVSDDDDDDDEDYLLDEDREDKERRVAQVVLAASPIYNHSGLLELLLEAPAGNNSPRSRPCVGILDNGSGCYTMVEIDLIKREFIIFHNLSYEVVARRLKAINPCHPMWYIPSREDLAKKKRLLFLEIREQWDPIPVKFKSPKVFCLPVRLSMAQP
ncbi:hypothetical protein ACA910_016690 [Epithemia clementina (nom. ined.)]